VLTFTDENLAVGTYKYQVSAKYEHCESDKTDEITITIVPELCEPPVIVSVTVEEYSVLLNWDAPENIDGELLGYNVYRDEEILNIDPITETEYVDEELADGTYKYQISAVYEHCESEKTEGEIVTVSIKNLQLSSFDIFPNPTKNELRITNYELRIENIAIYDVYGKIVLSHTANRTPQIEINVSHLQSGVYFVKAYFDNNEVAVKRLVIMK